MIEGPSVLRRFPCETASYEKASSLRRSSRTAARCSWVHASGGSWLRARLVSKPSRISSSFSSLLSKVNAPGDPRCRGRSRCMDTPRQAAEWPADARAQPPGYQCFRADGPTIGLAPYAASGAALRGRERLPKRAFRVRGVGAFRELLRPARLDERSTLFFRHPL